MKAECMGMCMSCGGVIDIGQNIRRSRKTKGKYSHTSCAGQEQGTWFHVHGVVVKAIVAKNEKEAKRIAQEMFDMDVRHVEKLDKVD